MRLWKDESGQAFVLAVLSMSMLLGFMALAVDVGVLFRAKRNVQIAADAAAMAAALEYKYNLGAGSTIATNRAYAAAYAAATANGYTDGTVVHFPTGTGMVTVTPNLPPVDGPNFGTQGFAEVTISAPNPTYFMSMFNYNGIKVGARAVAGRTMTENCVYLLGGGGTDFQNGGTINLGNSGALCGLIDNSSGSSAYVNSGTVNALSIGVVGGTSGSGSPLPTTGIAPSGNPLNLSPPSAAGCTNLKVSAGGNTNVPAGCYSQLEISASGATVAFSGTYEFTGPITVDAHLTNVTLQTASAGATLYLANPSASINFNSVPEIELSAPIGGQWNGILIYQDPGDANSLLLEGGPNSSLQGIIYAPSATVDLSSATGMSLTTSFVVNQLINTAGSFTVQDYLQVNSSSPLAKVALVE